MRHWPGFHNTGGERVRMKRPSFKLRDGALELSGGGDGRPVALMFPDIHVTKFIGSGANGFVFTARDTLDRDVAVKVWFRFRLESMDRARDETQKLAVLGNNPFFVIVHRFGELKGFPYAVMERIQGSTVKQWLKAESPNLIHRVTAWRIFSWGLHFAYERNILHGDPHAGNIFIFPDPANLYAAFRGNVATKLRHYSGFAGSSSPSFGLKIADFGASRLWSSKGAFVRRECVVLKETALRMLGNRVSELLDLSDVTEPTLILDAVDSASNVMVEAESISQQIRDLQEHDFLKELADIARWIVQVPLFKLDNVIRNLLFPGRQLDYFMEQILEHIGTRDMSTARLSSNYLAIPYAECRVRFLAMRQSLRRSSPDRA